MNVLASAPKHKWRRYSRVVKLYWGHKSDKSYSMMTEEKCSPSLNNQKGPDQTTQKANLTCLQTFAEPRRRLRLADEEGHPKKLFSSKLFV